jgi:hypothetical protein
VIEIVIGIVRGIETGEAITVATVMAPAPMEEVEVVRSRRRKKIRTG